MRSKEGLTLSGVTLTKDGINAQTGDEFTNPSALECLEDGALKITWRDGTNADYLHFKEGMANPIICSKIVILSGRFNISQVD